MRRLICHLMLTIALVFQGVTVVGAVPSENEQQEHCAGHSAAQPDCTCCPDGAMGGANCTAQCSVSQAPMVVLVPERIETSSLRFDRQPLTAPGPDYLPLVPPPIS